MSLAERISQQQILRERAAAENRRLRDQQRANQEAQRRQEQEQNQEEIKRLQAEQKELEKQIAEFEEYERNPELYREKQLSDLNKSISEKYDPLIADIEARKSTAVNKAIQDTIEAARQRGSGGGPSEWKEIARQTAKGFDQEIENLQREKNTQYQLSVYQLTYPNRPLQGSVLRTFKAEGGQVSLVGLQQRRDEAAEARRQYNIQSSITTAKSEKAKFDQQLEALKIGYEKSREQKSTDAAILEKLTKESKNLKSAEGGKYEITKEYKIETRQGNLKSDPFKDLPDVDPESIYGTTLGRSEKAIATFEQTQKEQRELEKQIRGASGKAEADRIRSKFQSDNPYVGTPNILKQKNRTVDVQGVTISKELNTAIKDFETKTLNEPNPKTTKQFTISLEESLNLDSTLGGSALVRIPLSESNTSTRDDVLIQDEKGNIRSPNVDEMWLITKQNLDLSQVDFKQSKTDYELYQYEKENLDKITAFEPVAAKRETLDKQLEKQLNPKLDPFSQSLSDYVGEQADFIRSEIILNPKTPEIYKGLGYTEESARIQRERILSKPRESLETAAISDLSNEIKAGIGLAPRQESRTIKLIEEKSKSDDGKLWIAGSIAATGGTIAASIFVPGFIQAKLANIGGRKLIKEASDIAIKISSKADDAKFVQARQKEIESQLIKQYKVPKERAQSLAQSITTKPEERNIIESYKKIGLEISREDARKNIQNLSQTPYEIDILDKKTALITVGSESSEIQRVVLFQRGQKVSKVFEAPSERTTIIKSILQRGGYSDRSEIATAIRKQNANIKEEDLQKQIDQISKDLEKGKVITTRKQAVQAQKEKPLIQETKEKIAIGERLVKVIKGTANPQFDKIKYTRYPATEKNIKLAEDETQYLTIGTEKTVKTKDLKKFPQQVIQSIEKEDPTSLGIIIERKPKTKITLKSESKKESRPFTKATSYTEGKFKITPDTQDKIQINTGSKSSTVTTESKKFDKDINKLYETAKQSYTPAKDYSKQIRGSVQAGMASAGFAERSISAQQTKQQQKQESFQRSSLKINMGLDQRQDEISISKIIPDMKQDELIKAAINQGLRIKTSQDAAGRYSLLSELGLKESQLESLKQRIVTRQKQILKLDTPTPTPTKAPPRTVNQQPPKPIININITPKNQPKAPKQKAGKLYFAWNVNELSPGYYLPTKELTTGKTAKAIRKVERIQRKESKRKIRFNLY